MFSGFLNSNNPPSRASLKGELGRLTRGDTKHFVLLLAALTRSPKETS